MTKGRSGVRLANVAEYRERLRSSVGMFTHKKKKEKSKTEPTVIKSAKSAEIENAIAIETKTIPDVPITPEESNTQTESQMQPEEPPPFKPGTYFQYLDDIFKEYISEPEKTAGEKPKEERKAPNDKEVLELLSPGENPMDLLEKNNRWWRKM